jgi:hypothetical protein
MLRVAWRLEAARAGGVTALGVDDLVRVRPRPRPA